MPTLITAGDASNGVVVTSANDNALTIQTGAAGAKVNAAAFASDGTLTLVKPMAGGSLTLGTAQNTTSGTSRDFTGIPSWVNRITMPFNNVSTNGASNLQIQLGTGGAPTTSGYQGNSIASTAAGNSSALSTTGFVLLSGGAAGLHCGVAMFVRLSGNTWAGTVMLGQSDTSRSLYTFASVSLAGALDMVRLTTVGGTDTFDAGSVNILYEG